MHGTVYECTKSYVTVYKIFYNLDNPLNAPAKKQEHHFTLITKQTQRFECKNVPVRTPNIKHKQ